MLHQHLQNKCAFQLLNRQIPVQIKKFDSAVIKQLKLGMLPVVTKLELNVNLQFEITCANLRSLYNCLQIAIRLLLVVVAVFTMLPFDDSTKIYIVDSLLLYSILFYLICTKSSIQQHFHPLK